MRFAGENRDDVRERPSLPPWGYKFEPPFCVFSMQCHEFQDAHYFATFKEAVKHFIRFHVGPIEGREVSIIDDNMQIVLAYGAHNADGVVHWLGTRQGFAEFAKYHDQATVAIWETEALAGQEPPDTIPKDVVR